MLRQPVFCTGISWISLGPTRWPGEQWQHPFFAGDVSDGSGDPDIDRVVQGGVPAAPETLRFAGYLVNNATQTSTRFENYSFSYAKTSSNPIDNFADQIQEFIKKVEQFLSLMLKYVSERAIADLEAQVHNFSASAEDDLNIIVDNVVDAMLVNPTTSVLQVDSHKARRSFHGKAFVDAALGHPQ